MKKYFLFVNDIKKDGKIYAWKRNKELKKIKKNEKRKFISNFQT